MNEMSIALNNIGFAVGTGRCGTKFLADLLGREPSLSSSHERNPLNETFHRYAQWYRLPVDHTGFLKQKNIEISRDLKSTNYSFESSAYLAFSLLELFDEFKCRIIFMTRNPVAVVNSYFAKGYYDQPLHRIDGEMAPSYQPGMELHHFLGRIVPIGEFANEWNALSRIGKISWYWAAVNKRIQEQLEQLPDGSWHRVALERFDYEAYRELMNFLGLQTTTTKEEFETLVASKPNHLGPTRTVESWSQQENREFSLMTATIARELGYGDQVSPE